MQKHLTYIKLLSFIIILLSNINCKKEYSATGNRPIPPLTNPLNNCILIPGDTFKMGSPFLELWRKTDEIQHKVFVDSFYISKYSVSVADFKKFIISSNYNYNIDANKPPWGWIDNHPIVNVNFIDATHYCNWLSTTLGYKPCYSFYTDKNGNDSAACDFTKNGFRLPTEAEWEYACRAGMQTPFATGNNITTDQANYDGHFPYNTYPAPNPNPNGKRLGKTVPVDSAKYFTNAFGLNQMHGNVWQWVWDWYSAYPASGSPTQINPQGPILGTRHILRGGSWDSDGHALRSAYRYDTLNVRYSHFGFRIAKNK